MKALLFILAVALGLLALASRKHLSRQLDPDDDDNTEVEQTLKKSESATQNMSDAVTRLKTRAPVAPNPGAPPQGITQAPVIGKPVDANLAQEVSQYIKEMSENPDNAVGPLEKGLNATTNPENASLHLSLLQAALNSPAESSMRDVALRELTSNAIEQQVDGGNSDPAQSNTLQTRRQIVGTAYKLYLNTTKDAETTYTDTLRVLNYQKDQGVKDMIMYDCLSRFPELRIRMMNNSN